MYHLKNYKGSVGLCVAAVVAAGLLVGAALLLPGSTAHAQSGADYYVDENANGGATGLTWADAYTNVQDALFTATYGAEIWVAQGVYYPDEGSTQTNNNQDSTFTMKPGVALYGGFPTGGGTRDWEANVTVLSGDIDGDDTTDVDGVVTDTTNIKNKNAYHVVTGGAVTETAVLDGFTVTAGKADGDDPDNKGGGMYNNISSPELTNVTFSGNYAGDGGAMWNTYSSPELTNVTFSGNYAGDGGAMRNTYSSPELTNVTFSGNSAKDGGAMWNTNSDPTLMNVTFSGSSANDGGAMWNTYSDPTLTNVTFSGSSAREGGAMWNSNSNPTLTNVTFSGNFATADRGGGMYNNDSSSTLTNVTFSGNYAANTGGGMYNNDSSPTLMNVVFSGNSAAEGGGMYNYYESSPTLTNVTFGGNWANDYGGALSDNLYSNPTLTNCTLWGNTATTGTQVFNGQSSDPTFSYSDIQGSGGSAGWDATLGIDGGDNIDTDPLFVDQRDASEAPTTAGNYRLQLGSPAIDVGDNDAVPTGVTTDLDGNPRIVDGTGDGNAIVDMGAYERQQAPQPVGGATVVHPLSGPLAAVAALFGLLLAGAVGGLVQRRA